MKKCKVCGCELKLMKRVKGDDTVCCDCLWKDNKISNEARGAKKRDGDELIQNLNTLGWVFVGGGTLCFLAAFIDDVPGLLAVIASIVALASGALIMAAAKALGYLRDIAEER